MLVGYENSDEDTDEDDDKKFMAERPKPFVRNAGIVIVGISLLVVILNWREIAQWLLSLLTKNSHFGRS